MVRRSKFELYGDVLDVLAEGPLKKTRVMYAANLCIRSLDATVRQLLENGLITETVTDSKQGTQKHYTYAITPTGVECLRHYRAYKTKVSSTWTRGR